MALKINKNTKIVSKNTKLLKMRLERVVSFQDDFIPENFHKDDVELKEVIIPNGITIIRGEAFCGCSNLTSVTIPSSLTRIEWNAFRGCTSLETIKLPSNINEIECSLDIRGVSKLTLSEPFEEQEIIKFLVDGYAMEFNPDNHWD